MKDLRKLKWIMFRKRRKPIKCVVCNKILRKHNKLGLCYQDSKTEYHLNYRKQGFMK